MKHRTKSNKGFTLIEMIVVIGIIGLISSVIVVSLRSARDKADNSYTIQTIRQYMLALELVRNKTGSLPAVTSPNTWVCLGNPPSGQAYCMYNDIFPDPLIVSALGQFIPSLPSPNPKVIINQNIPPANGGPSISGSVYTCTGTSCSATLDWILKGVNQSCFFSGALAVPYGTGTYCRVVIPGS